METFLQSFVEGAGSVYNIKHGAFYFSKNIVPFVGKQRYEKIYFYLFSQLLQSETSIGANLTEGVAGSSKKDFINYHTIALKYANKAKYWLCLLKETLFADKILIEDFTKEASEISKL